MKQATLFTDVTKKALAKMQSHIVKIIREVDDFNEVKHQRRPSTVRAEIRNKVEALNINDFIE